MLLLELCSTSQQERRQAAGREEVLEVSLHERKQDASQRGCKNSGNCPPTPPSPPPSSLKLLLCASSTCDPPNDDGRLPVKALELTSSVCSIGSVPMTCSSAPVSRLLESCRAAREGK